CMPQKSCEAIMPQYIILKPSLCGGFQASNRWIALARQRDIGWWATSAMESDIGLNAIAQWVSCFNPQLPQGLGTGELYDNNIPSPVRLCGDRLSYDPPASWHLPDTLQWR
ncbi:MAG: o-succinylbenzoate synthase, partial [Muribaculaceae bacterium]|nr:o-succinylbenzoate synthase [Muribaculaceae bacterium]